MINSHGCWVNQWEKPFSSSFLPGWNPELGMGWSLKPIHHGWTAKAVAAAGEESEAWVDRDERCRFHQPLVVVLIKQKLRISPRGFFGHKHGWFVQILASGKRLQFANWRITIFISSVNQLFLCAIFNSYVTNYQRLIIIMY